MKRAYPNIDSDKVVHIPRNSDLVRVPPESP